MQERSSGAQWLCGGTVKGSSTIDKDKRLAILVQISLDLRNSWHPIQGKLNEIGDVCMCKNVHQGLNGFVEGL